ncbi:hypothetical protein LguiA_025144 [Lonicera macranthoides]
MEKGSNGYPAVEELGFLEMIEQRGYFHVFRLYFLNLGHVGSCRNQWKRKR